MRKILIVLLLLSACVRGFAQFEISGADEYVRQKAEQTERMRLADSIRLSQLEDKQTMANDIRFKVKWINMVTYRQSIGFVENSYNLSYYGYMVTKEKWTFPISFRMTGAQDYNPSNMKTGFASWSQHITDLGLSGFRKIKGNEYISLGLHVPMGYEKYYLNNDPKKHIHLLIGASTEERLMYISPNKTGLMMSVGFYQTLINSRRYSLDAGFSLEIGVKF